MSNIATLTWTFIALLCFPQCVLARELHPSQYTYSIRYKVEKVPGGYTVSRSYLDQIDVNKDEIIWSTSIDGDYNYITILNPDETIMTMARGVAESKRKVGLFDVEKRRFKKEFETKNWRPHWAIPINGELYINTERTEYREVILDGKPDRRGFGTSIFEIYDLDTLKWKREITLPEQHRTDLAEDTYVLSHDGSKIAISTFYMSFFPKEHHKFGSGLLILLSTKDDRELNRIDTYPYFGDPSGIAMSKNGKIYAIATYAKPGVEPGVERPANKSVFVFSEKTFKLLKKIEAIAHPGVIKFSPTTDQIFLANTGWNETAHQLLAIDTYTDEIQWKIELPGIRTMSYGGNKKLYVTTAGGKPVGPGKDPGILVVDTANGKVIKKIPGEYGPLSYHPIPWEPKSN